MKMIYLACPYSAPDPRIQMVRAQIATAATAQLIAEGYLVYSPITLGHAVAFYDLTPTDWHFWQAHCASFLRKWADALFVLTLPGWDKSVGVRAELELATEMHLGIKFLAVDEEDGRVRIQDNHHQENRLVANR